ncbi:MAG TPA: GTP-binding protein, partial [Ktedonobacteraceae bacterium]
AGTYRLALQPGPDPQIHVALLPLQEATQEALEAIKMETVLLFSSEEEGHMPGDTLHTPRILYNLHLPENNVLLFNVVIAQAGFYALYTQHHPSEFQLELRDEADLLVPETTHEYKPKHEHDDAVLTVGIDIAGDLDPRKLNSWLSNLLRTQGPDIFRMKGVLSLKGEANRFVFQGVHMLFDGRPDRSWGSEARRNSLIFIGRNLDRKQLNEGFRACLV